MGNEATYTTQPEMKSFEKTLGRKWIICWIFSFDYEALSYLAVIPYEKAETLRSDLNAPSRCSGKRDWQRDMISF